MMSSNSSTHTKRACEDRATRKKVTHKAIEMWEVAQLNCKMGSFSRPTDLFDRIEERRKKRHENALRQFAICLHGINQKTEKNISISSTELKAHFKHYKDILQEILVSIDKPEVASYSGSVFLTFQNKANKFKAEQKKLVYELFDDLMKFEDNRAKENEKVFHIACEELRKIGYFLPYEVQIFAEHETLKMNQLSLNNRRCYHDLKLSLTLLTEQTYKLFMDKVFCVKEKWVQFKLQEAYFNKHLCTDKKSSNTHEIYKRLELKGHELMLQLSSDEMYNICNVENWSKNISQVAGIIENYKKSMMDIYRKTLNAVYKSFEGEFDEFQKDLETIKTLCIEERTIKPILFEARYEEAKQIEEFEVFWQETLFDVSKTFGDITGFLNDVGFIWENHMRRVCESKKLILLALEKVNEEANNELQDLGVRVNLALDNLRQEHIKTKLEKAYEDVVNLLKLIRKNYENMYVSETTTIEDFYDMMKLESDVLSAELKEFLYTTHPMENVRHPYFSYDHGQDTTEENFVFKEIQKCSQHVKSTKSWKQGVWAAMESLSIKTREFFEPKAETWVEKKIQILGEKLSVQLELLEKRFKRIEVEIYKKRLAEIEYHSNVFEEHKQGLKMEFAKMKEALNALNRREINKLHIIENGFPDIETNAKDENRPQVIKSDQIMIERRREEIEVNVTNTFKRFQADCETKSANLKMCNVEFMKAIKLFHENGNYSAEEGKMFANMLEGLDKFIDAETIQIFQNAKSVEADVLNKYSETFAQPIQLFTILHEETLFNQDYQARLNDLREDLEKYIDDMNFDFNFLNNYIMVVYNLVKKRTPLRSKTSKLKWQTLINSLYKNISNLFYYAKVPDILGEDEEELEVTQIDSDQRDSGLSRDILDLPRKNTKQRTFSLYKFTKIEEPFAGTDFQKDIFNGNSPPISKDTFMEKVTERIYNEMGYLQKYAYSFYRRLQGRNLIRDDLIPLTYESFGADAKTKLQQLNNQCEQLWLERVTQMLSIIGKIKVMANYQYERKLDDYESLAISSLRIFQDDFLTCLAVCSNESSRELAELDNKLLTLHGYPNNARLLQKLEDEVIERAARLGKCWNCTVAKFKNQLNCFQNDHLLYQKEVREIERHFLLIKNKIFTDVTGINLIEFLMPCVDRLGYCMIRKLEGDDFPSPGESNVVTDLPEDVHAKDDTTFDNYLTIRAYYKKLRDIIQLEMMETPESSESECHSCNDELTPEDPCWRACKEKLKFLLSPVDSESYFESITPKIRASVNKMKSLAKLKEDSHDEVLLKWLSKWKYNVKKIKKIYTVKYIEHLPEIKKQGPDETLLSRGMLSRRGTSLVVTTRSRALPRKRKRSFTNINNKSGDSMTSVSSTNKPVESTKETRKEKSKDNRQLRDHLRFEQH